MVETVTNGVNVLPERTVSIRAGASVIWEPSLTPASTPPAEIRSPESGIGWTNAKQASAITVTTVAQVLTKVLDMIRFLISARTKP